MRVFCGLMVALVGLGLFAANGGGAPQQVEADPNNNYLLTEANAPQIGEWMVLVAHYTGPDAPVLAQQMAYQIRSQIHLPAYTFAYEDEGGKALQKQMEEAEAAAQKIITETGAYYYGRKKRINHFDAQYGVLIGAWATLADGNKALVGIRKLQAPEIRSPSGLSTTDMVGEWEQQQDGRLRQTKQKAVNPFSTAILTRNPALKKQSLANQVDPLLKKLNEYEDFSLLKCPHKYTLLLKEFAGTSTIQQVDGAVAEKKDGGFLAMVGMGGHKEGDGLNAVALQAHNLAAMLRKMNLEAFVLHSKTTSAVTIGGFDDVHDPAVQRILQQLADVRQEIMAKNKFDPQLFKAVTDSPVAVAIPRP